MNEGRLSESDQKRSIYEKEFITAFRSTHCRMRFACFIRFTVIPFLLPSGEDSNCLLSYEGRRMGRNEQDRI
jgi:hypothetical protein